MNRVQELSVTAVLSAAAASLRIIKHLIAGPIQFVNIPAVFAIIGGAVFGARIGFLVGLFSFVISDFILGSGPWTAVNSILCGLIGVISSVLWYGETSVSRLEVGATTYLLLFMNDILNSMILYLLLGFSIQQAAIISVVGLFLPIAGGWMFFVGPITEGTTSVLAATLMPEIRERLQYVLPTGESVERE